MSTATAQSIGRQPPELFSTPQLHQNHPYISNGQNLKQILYPHTRHAGATVSPASFYFNGVARMECDWHAVPFSENSTNGCQDNSKLAVPHSVELVLHDEESGETHPLHSQNYDIEAIFDIFKGNLRLTEKVRDQEIWPETLHKEAICLTRSNSIFVNLEGLNDRSILFSFQPKSSIKADLATKLKLCRQSHAFIYDVVDSPLCKAIVDCTGDNRTFRLRLPMDRHQGWRTIALILLTYRKIVPKTWYRIVTNNSLLDVAGFDWRHVCQSTPDWARVPLDH